VHVTLIECIVVSVGLLFWPKLKQMRLSCADKAKSLQSNSKSSFCFLFKFNER